MKKRYALILAAFFLWNTVFPFSYAGEDMPRQEESALQSILTRELEETAPLEAEQIVIYNNAYDPENPCSPMVYVTGLSRLGTGITIRVYDKTDPQVRSLLGSHQVEDTTHGFTVQIPVAELSPMGGAVYVTIQKEGMAESEPVRADYAKACTAYASLETIKIQEKYAYDRKEFAYSQPLYTPGALKAGSYYLVDVKLTNFHTVGGATIPLRYNTDYLELVPIVPSTKMINTASTVEAKEGAWFNFAGKTGSYRASLQCGVLPGFHTDYGTVGAVDDYPVATSGSDLGEYPYLNTATGLVKLEIMKSKYGAFTYNDGKASSGTSVVRLVFRAKQDGTGLSEMSDLVHFATIADYIGADGAVDEEGRPTDRDMAAKYYATRHPAGISVTLEDAQLLRTPPAITLTGVDFPPESPVIIGAADLAAMPESFEAKATAFEMPENSVKIYNYTNAQSYVSGLDAYLSDRLIISPSQESGVIYGDRVSVYGDSALSQLLAEGKADSEGAVSIDLQNQLSAEGGRVYVTNSRAGVVSSAVAFDYPPEASRDVTFRIYRTALPAGIAEGTDPTVKPEALANVQKGEQFQIQVYFNDINDLMGYTFPIHFNTRAVKAADRYFQPVEMDGYMSETDFYNGRTPFSVGTDIGSLTTAELIIYYAQESEIPGLMAEMGISSREEWEKRKQDIQVKIEYGVSGGPGIWNGGILFTGPRGETAGEAVSGADTAPVSASDLAGAVLSAAETAYPYVDNNRTTGNASGDGLIKIWATSLTSPVTRLERDGGYHFLTMNFTGVTNVTSENAEFRFAEKGDGAYDGANPEGGRLVVSGPEESAGKNVSFHWEVYSMEEISAPTGTTMGGIVRSWNPASETVLTLSQNGQVCGVTTVGGVGAVERVGAGASAKQSFTLEGVMPGTYSLRISKGSHVDVLIDGLVVGEGPLDLTRYPDARVREILLPCGDVDGDGKIGLMDRELLLLSRYYGKTIALLPEAERAAAACLDLDGDGLVKKVDLLILMASPNYGKSAVHIDLGE